ncbi:lipase family alpha/beta hydrolase [Marinobacterium litorale]|uniref:lipase family alpha/beta hydrolase n=1 Tax=Marinobacterium litorale TaxID=404770 RepID=UPI00040404DD|nr:alpha/beta fold hydrolase [Marinobacterium litorale]
MANQPHIVLIHGLYMSPLVMRPMGRWFEDKGYSTSAFGYRTTSDPLELNVEQLTEHLNGVDADDIYLVCHSLGGLLARAYLESAGEKPPVRKLVTIGTPHQGAAIARWLKANRLGALLGQSLEKGLIENGAHWALDIPLGSIAGDGGIGLLPLIGGGGEPSDGTVAVSETHIEGESDHIVLPYSHTQLILVSEVYEQALRFIQTGRFEDR